AWTPRCWSRARRRPPAIRGPRTSRSRSRPSCWAAASLMGVLDRPVCLIVNPSAGGGRAGRLLPGVEAELRALGLPFRVQRTTSMDHARELARGARDAGEVAAAMGGDGL